MPRRFIAGSHGIVKLSPPGAMGMGAWTTCSQRPANWRTVSWTVLPLQNSTPLRLSLAMFGHLVIGRSINYYFAGSEPWECTVHAKLLNSYFCFCYKVLNQTV